MQQTPSSKRLYVMAVFLAFVVLYFVCSFAIRGSFARDCLFGASQFQPWGVVPFLAVFLPLLSVPLVTEKIRDWGRRASGSSARAWSHRPVATLLMFLVATSVCFLLRNNTLNPDALAFAGKFAQDVPTHGAHLTHDEILELFVHSRFWAITHAWFGWDVTLSYQVLSALAGGTFFCMLFRYCRAIGGGQAGILFWLVASGGFVQLFFGDVENYTLTSVWLLGYLFSSALHLRGACGPVLPCICLGIAMMFHLLSGFMLPSLAYLLQRDWRQGNRTRVAVAAIALIAIPVATLTWFHFNGLPIQRLFYNSHAFGHGGNIVGMLVSPSLEYYAAVVNLVFLLMPVASLLPLGFFRTSCFRDPLVRHLAIASAMMVIYMCSWNAQLGVYEDWNLFANAALPVSILAGLCAVEAVGRESRIALVPLAIVWSLHTGTWIVGNHNYRYYVGRTLQAHVESLERDGTIRQPVVYSGIIKRIDAKRGILLATKAGDIQLPADVGGLHKMPRKCLCLGARGEEADFTASWIARSY
jgi:hypothetical protein